MPKSSFAVLAKSKLSSLFAPNVRWSDHSASEILYAASALAAQVAAGRSPPSTVAAAAPADHCKKLRRSVLMFIELNLCGRTGRIRQTAAREPRPQCLEITQPARFV